MEWSPAAARWPGAWCTWPARISRWRAARLARSTAAKIAESLRHSLETGTPFVFINDSGGARVQEGVGSLAGYAQVFYNNVMLSGVVPQISLICGPCAGGAAYSPALTDFIIQTRYAYMFITGPAVIKQVTNEVITAEQLGGARAQMNNSGVVHFVADNDVEAIKICKNLLSFLPSNNMEDPPRGEQDRKRFHDFSLNYIVPDESKLPYDMHEIITRIVDKADFLEVQKEFAKNLLIGFGRIVGRPVGIIANQPSVLAGALDINASDKGARFIRFCNAFNIPLVTLVDVPGFLPGVRPGIRRHHPPRRQAAVRLLGRHRSQAHGGDAQGLRRRLHRHVLQGPGRGSRVRLALRRDRRDGRGGRGGNRVPPRDCRG